VHAPGDEVNRGLVNAERLALLKPSAIFINTARGVLVDEDALYAALTSGQLAGAGLDVRVSEPPTEQRFEALKNVVLTSHVAGSTYASQALTGVMVVDAVLKSASGEVPHGIVNADVWAQRRAV
jgi:D-3-phosphoglycerate dehydrogenase